MRCLPARSSTPGGAPSTLVLVEGDRVRVLRPGAIGAETSTLHIKTTDSDWVELSVAHKTISAGRILRMIERLT